QYLTKPPQPAPRPLKVSCYSRRNASRNEKLCRACDNCTNVKWKKFESDQSVGGFGGFRGTDGARAVPSRTKPIAITPRMGRMIASNRTSGIAVTKSARKEITAGSFSVYPPVSVYPSV